MSWLGWLGQDEGGRDPKVSDRGGSWWIFTISTEFLWCRTFLYEFLRRLYVEWSTQKGVLVVVRVVEIDDIEEEEGEEDGEEGWYFYLSEELKYPGTEPVPSRRRGSLKWRKMALITLWPY